MILSGCASQFGVAGGGAGPLLRAPIKLATGSVRADVAVVGDATQILKESIDDSLSDAKMTCHGTSGACATIDLYARLRPPARAFSEATPPLRVAELVAEFRGSPGAPTAATMSYQRTVAIDGNLSTATWMRLSAALTEDLAGDFRFRSGKGGVVVRLPAWATMTTSLPKSSQPRSFHVANTSDSRSDDDTIGTVGGHEVRLARRATDYITEMLTDDLRGAGHLIVPGGDGRLVGSELEKFWVSSVESGGGWETTVEIQVDLEVAPPPGIKRKKAERHSCSMREHSSQMPGEPDLARILEHCLGELAGSIRNDSAWSLGQG
ncbi:MAG TPA: hypothetical protein VGK20_11820 [Candidatus Binatia bacterium]